MLFFINSEAFALNKQIEFIIRMAFQNGMHYVLSLDKDEYELLKKNMDSKECIEERIQCYTDIYIQVVEGLSSEKNKKKIKPQLRAVD
jgi:hypothetical protein